MKFDKNVYADKISESLFPNVVFETSALMVNENSGFDLSLIHIYLNLSVFHMIFAHIYGDTPYSHLKKYKMNLAAQMLTDGQVKIGDIALELGYSKASKFAKAFQSVYGVLPKDYRKNR